MIGGGFSRPVGRVWRFPPRLTTWFLKRRRPAILIRSGPDGPACQILPGEAPMRRDFRRSSLIVCLISLIGPGLARANEEAAMAEPL